MFICKKLSATRDASARFAGHTPSEIAAKYSSSSARAAPTSVSDSFSARAMRQLSELKYFKLLYGDGGERVARRPVFSGPPAMTAGTFLTHTSVRRNDGGHDLSTIRKPAHDRIARFSLDTYRPCERRGSRNALHRHAAPSMNDSHAPPRSSSSLRIFFICG
jgi:hypothetical protein